ncbi:34523_t:CDS:2, partial [Gigaspora margarita]
SRILTDKDTNRLKNSFSYHDKAKQSKEENGMVIEKQIVHPKKLAQKENIRRDQPISERAHLKRPFQALNNSRSVEKDQNKRGFSQQSHRKKFQKSTEVDAQPVEKDLINFLKKQKIIQSLTLPSWEELDNTRILSLPKKGKMNSKTSRTDLHQDTFSLSQISRKIKKCIDSIQRTEWPKIFERTNMHLYEIDIRHEIGIQLINSTDIAEIRLWLQDLKGWWFILNKRWQNEKEAANLKEIENFIELRCKCIQNEQDQKEENLVTHATEVKNKMQAFFQSQYKKRNTRLEDLPDKWKEIYKPQEWINEGIYKDLNGVIDEEKWS